MQGITKSMELFEGEQYRELEYGTIYYVPGASSQIHDNYVNAHADALAARLNSNDGNWVTCRIVCLDKDNPLFAPQTFPSFYSAMLPTNDTPPDAYNFLVGYLIISEPDVIMEALNDYFRTLQQLFDEILDEGTYRPNILRSTVLATLDDDLRCSAEGREVAVPEPCMKACECLDMAPNMACEEEEERFDYPSRLEITPNTFQVLLTDYCREIKFNAQIKALYVLFLNHPEGIRMAQIGDHKEEYKQLYLYFTNRSDTDQLRNAVERLFDVYSPNALNVKKSQCSAALRMAIPEDHLRRYYEIVVDRGEPHKINLDRSLVSMPDFLHHYSL